MLITMPLTVAGETLAKAEGDDRVERSDDVGDRT
jgi:hypothetical protein